MLLFNSRGSVLIACSDIHTITFSGGHESFGKIIKNAGGERVIIEFRVWSIFTRAKNAAHRIITVHESKLAQFDFQPYKDIKSVFTNKAVFTNQAIFTLYSFAI